MHTSIQTVSLLLILLGSTTFEGNAAERDQINLSDAQNISGHRPFMIIIVQRGSLISQQSHECSSTAIRLAAELGYVMVELNIQRSRDGVPEVFHDRRLTKSSSKNERGADDKAIELKSMAYLPGDDRIRRLESARKACPCLGLGVMLDLKSCVTVGESFGNHWSVEPSGFIWKSK